METSQIHTDTHPGQNNIKPRECQEELVKTPVMSAYLKNIANRLSVALGDRFLSFPKRIASITHQQADNSIKKPPLHQPLSWMIMLLFWGVLLNVVPVQAEKTSMKHPFNIIVLDPGHGGNDMGARSSDRLTEKQLAMRFVRAMTERLKKTYKVVLTRKDDYQINVFERSAIANHIKADLFVSIHTGASFQSHPRGMSLFYHDNPAIKDVPSAPQVAHSTESSNTIRNWGQTSSENIEKSRFITELIRKHITQIDPKLILTSSGAPLLILSGVNMPAILIEIGTITNPLDAKALNDEAYITELAQAMCDAIDDFFSNDLRL